ncbi:MIT domain-containing protein 1-like isoform X2 [Cherax quadricarinatus]|uniref:MIT domain-containing protein 1-like isoform X2 n=1 Tax=Cherax quadricarinatus TaxID=27406 RepID=UPI00387E87C6
MSGIGHEAAAVQVLTRAVQLDNEKKFSEALACYEQGIRLLLQAAKEVQDESKRSHFRKKTEEYLSRAEAMKEAAAKQRTLARTHTQIQIDAGATGYSYKTIFEPLIDKTLSSATVEDAYIRSTHQIYNFLQFCELLVHKAECLKLIVLQTTRDPGDHRTQHSRLEEIQHSLKKHNVTLTIEYSDTIHDREIRAWLVWSARLLLPDSPTYPSQLG